MTTSTSVMGADFGSVNTRVVVFDVVDGEYRLIARGFGHTTDGFPVNDLGIGLERVLKEIFDVTGRKLMENGTIVTPENMDRSGVDQVAMTASIGRPLRAVLLGLMPNWSVASALRATAGTYIEVAETIALDDGRDEQERLNAILLSLPDILFIVGGTEGGAQSAVWELARLAHLASSLIDKRRRPTVIFAGNNSLAPRVEALFEDVTTVFVARNVLPELEDEQIESARNQLGEAFDHYKETRSESFAAIGAMSSTGVLPTAQSYNIVVEYLGEAGRGNVAAVDIGSATGILAVSFNKATNISIRTEMGLGHSALTLLDTVGIDVLHKWLPLTATDSQIYNYAANKSLRPATVPMTVRSLHTEHTLLRTAIQTMIRDARPQWAVPPGPVALDLLIGAGAGLTNLGNPGYTAMLLLDSIQPTGVTLLQADPYGVIPALGAVADDNPEAVVQLLDGNALDTLGTAISASGKPRENRNAMRITLDFGDETIEHELEGGHLWVYPLGADETVTVKVRCSSEMSINGKRTVEFTARGGKAGLIFDARGRPLFTSDSVRERAQLIPMWISEVTGDEIIPIDEADLITADDLEDDVSALPEATLEALTADSDADEKPSRRRRGRKKDKKEKAEKSAKDDGGKKRRGLFGRRRKKDDDDSKPAASADDDDIFAVDDDDDFDFSEFEDDDRSKDDELGDLRSGILS